MRTCALLLMALSAWAAEPPAPSAETVKVYVYLSPTTWGYTFKVYAEDAVIAKFRWKSSKKQYFTADLEPGRHFFHAGGDTKNGITATLEPGRKYYLACADDSGQHIGVWIGRASIPCTLVDPEQGDTYIAKLTPAEPLH